MGSRITVGTPEGQRFEASVAWPTEHSVFLSTTELLTYGQQLSFRLFGVSVRARVAFVSLEPAGAVAAFSAPPEVQERLRLACEEQLEQVPEPTSEEWRERTEVPEEERSVEGFEIPTAHDYSVEDELSLQAEPPDLDTAHTSDDEIPSTSSPWGAGGAHEEPADEVSMDEWVEASTTGSKTVDTHPRLDRDGFTVRFDSLEQYKAQLDGNLLHGGLVVQHSELPLGSQRMLLLKVPSRSDYTVSARVVFNQPGAVGFMVDSISLHRDRLKAMGS